MGIRYPLTLAGGLLSLALLAAAALPTFGAGRYGECPLSGQWKTRPITKTLTSGTLVVRTNGNWPDWACGPKLDGCEGSTNFTGGFEYCLAAEIAQRGGVRKLKFVVVSFEETLKPGKPGWDMTLGISAFTDMYETFEFSRAYSFPMVGVVTASGTAIDDGTIRQARVGAMSGLMNAFAERTLKLQPSVTFEEEREATDALFAGRLDAVLMSGSTSSRVAETSDGKLVVAGVYSLGLPDRALFPKDSALQPEIDKILQSMIDDGTVAKLQSTYYRPLWRRDPAVYPLWTP